MIRLLLPLLLNSSIPVMYQDELGRDDTHIEVSLIPRHSLRPDTLSAMTGELPLSLYLLSLPLWPSMEEEWLPGGVEAEPPSLLAAQQTFFTRLLSGDTVTAWYEARYRQPDALTCRAGDYALWHQPFQGWLPEWRKGEPIGCLQTQALATFFMPMQTAVDISAHTENDVPVSSVFSVLNLTISSNSAPVPEWRPVSDLRAASSVEGIASNTFIFPLTHAVFVTSPYGMRYHPISHQFLRHEGADLRAAINSPVLSIADGQVVDTGYGPVTGFYVTINHADGWSSRYLHLSTISVGKGESVLKGNIIARSGNSGRSNGPHLHLEISRHHRLLDPMSVLFTTLISPNPQSARQEESVQPAPVLPEPVDMTPTIVLVGGEGNDIQIGVRIGKRTTFYALNEPIETDEGSWKIIKRYGKYKLVKRDTTKQQ